MTGFISRREWEEFKQNVKERLDAFHHGPGGLHELRNKLMAVPVLEAKVDDMEKDVRGIPNREEIKKELDHQTLILTTRIINFEERANDKARTIKWLVTLVAPFLFGVVTLLLTILAKAFKLL